MWPLLKLTEELPNITRATYKLSNRLAACKGAWIRRHCMPLQNMVTMDCITRTHRYASSPQAQAVAFNPVGQVVGMMNEVRSTREVIETLVGEYVDALEHLNSLTPE